MLVHYALAALSFVQTEIGCLTKVGSLCTQLCAIGIQDCSATQPTCEYGYFLFKNTCVQCPYYTANDIAKLYCMDCVESPYTWSATRKCSYEYSIEGSSTSDSTYIKIARTFTELYFIGDAIDMGISADTLPRDTRLKYQVYSCPGCKDFCNPTTDSTCNRIDIIYAVDSAITGITCLKGYYFKNSNCVLCPSNCSECDGTKGCTECQTGYQLINPLTCTACLSGCSKCLTLYKMDFCLYCTLPKITSLDLQKCETCGNDCSTCEYTTYQDKTIVYPTRQMAYIDRPDQPAYIKRCRSCNDQSLIISYNGVDCAQCDIFNCEKCFYVVRTQGPDEITTLDIDFEPVRGGEMVDSVMKCLKCMKGTYLSQDRTQCLIGTITTKPNCEFYQFQGGTNYDCKLCAEGYIYDQRNKACFGSCYDQITNCLKCYAYESLDQKQFVDASGNVQSRPAQTLFQCITCEDGYYPDFFTGQCLACPLNCQSCVQETTSNLYTDYLLKMKPINDALKQQYMNIKPINVRCKECKKDYSLYGNQCLGCTKKCQIKNPDNASNSVEKDSILSCVYKSTFAFCSQCYDSFNDRSTTADLSQCHSCPTNCMACRDRTSSEIVNPYFNPSNSDLLQYGRLCYKVQSQTGSTNQVVTYNSILGIPIVCKYAPILASDTKRCRNSGEGTVYVYCDTTSFNTVYATLTTEEKMYYYNLASIYTIDSETEVNLDFINIENLSYYVLMNALPLESFTLNIVFVQPVLTNGERICNFPKPTVIAPDFHQNVFGLVDFKVYVKADTDITFKLDGNLTFKDQNYIEIIGIKFKPYSLLPFGIVVTGTLPTKLTLNNLVMGHTEESLVTPVFTLQLNNIKELAITSVKFNYFKITDKIVIQTNSSVLQYQKLSITQMLFYKCKINGVVLFPLISSDQSLIKINQLIFDQCTLTKVFGIVEYVFTKSYGGRVIVSGLAFKFCQLQAMYFIVAEGLQQFQLDYTDVYRSNLNDSTLFISNEFQVHNIFVSESNFVKSYIFLNAQQMNPDLFTQLGTQTFSNIKFIKNDCQNANCIMNYQTPFNLVFDQLSFTLSNVQIELTDVQAMELDQITSVQASLILIKQVKHVYLSEITINDNYGMPAIKISEIQSLELVGLQCDWTGAQVGQIASNPINQPVPFSKITYPLNSKIPTSFGGADQKKQFKSFTSYCLYISQFTKGVWLKNIVLKRLLSIDTSFIYIQSYDVLEKDTSLSERDVGRFYSNFKNELVILENIRIFNSSLTISLITSKISPIVIESSQTQIIQITDFKAIGNHLHSVIDGALYPSTSCLLISSPSSDVTLSNGYFNQNRVTQSNFGLLWINAKKVTIVNSIFKETNVVQKFWLDRLEEYQFRTNSSADIVKFFGIDSDGSNMYLKAATIVIDNITMDNAQGQHGTGIYIDGQETVRMLLTNSKFSNLISSLNPSDNTKGGGIYIDSSQSSLELNITNVTMDQCVARFEGGCLYVLPSFKTQLIVIQNSTFTRCQALKTSFLAAEFPLISQQFPIIVMVNNRIEDNMYTNFLAQLPDISTLEKTYLLIQSAVLSQSYGQLLIQGCQFVNLTHTSIIRATSMVNVSLSGVLIQGHLIFSTPTLNIGMHSSGGTITFSQVSLVSTKEVAILSETALNALPYPDCREYLVTMNQTILDEQTYPNMTVIRTYYTMLYNIQAVADSQLYTAQYQSNYDVYDSNYKYKMPTIDYETFVEVPILNYIPEITITNYQNVSTVNQFANCFYSLIYESNLVKSQVAIINLSKFYKTNYMYLSQVTIKDSVCSRCYGGLMQMKEIQQTSVPRIVIQDLSCYSNQAGYYGCLTFSNEDVLTEFVSDFPMNRVLADITELKTLLSSTPHSIQISKSQFQLNQATIGAGLTILGLNASVESSKFMDNTALRIGGAIAYKNMGFQLILLDNTFQGNIAQVAGAIYMYGTSLPNMTLQNIDMHNNNGTLLGSGSEELPSRLSISMKIGNTLPIESFLQYDGDMNDDGMIDNTSTPIIDQIRMPTYKVNGISSSYLLLPSGQQISKYKYYYNYTEEQVPFEWIFRIVNLDRQQQKMSSGKASDSCSIKGRIQDEYNYDDTKAFYSNFTDQSSVQFNTVLGAYNLDSLNIIFDPYIESNLYLQLKIQCSSVQIPVYDKSPPYSILGYNANYALYLNIKTLPCQIGEAYTVQKCVACPDDGLTYSVTADSYQCSGINTQSMQQVTPIKIKLQPGYWRSKSDSNIIVSCYNLAENCNGGWIPNNPSCYAGHVGALCESCDIYGIRGESYSISKKYACGECANTVETNSLTITAISVFTLVSMILSVRGNYQMLETFIRDQVLQSMGVRTSTQQNNLSILMKLLMNYLQIIRSLTQFRIAIPTAFTQSMEVLGNPTQSMAYSLDCFLVLMTSVDILYFRMIWALLMPVLYLVIFFFGYFIAVLIGQAPYKTGIIYTTFIYMFIYLQPTLVGGFVSLVSSRTIGGQDWVQSDVNYKYDDSQHQLWMSVFVVPLLLLWSVFLPLFFMHCVRRISKVLYQIESRRKWGYFYNEYTQGAYLWEFVKIFEKELVIISLTYYEDKIVIKGLLVFLVVFFYGAFSFYFTPYKSKRLNLIDHLSTSVCAVSLCLGVLIFASESESLDYLQISMFLIIALINLFFILYILYNLFEGYLTKFQDQLDKLRDWIKQKYPNLELQYPQFRKYLRNQKERNQRIKDLWSNLRYATRRGIERRRKDGSPIFQEKGISMSVEVSQEKELLRQSSKGNAQSVLIQGDGQDYRPKSHLDSRRNNSQHFLNSQAQTPDREDAKVHPMDESPEVPQQPNTLNKRIRDMVIPKEEEHTPLRVIKSRN